MNSMQNLIDMQIEETLYVYTCEIFSSVYPNNSVIRAVCSNTVGAQELKLSGNLSISNNCIWFSFIWLKKTVVHEFR